MTEKLMSAYLSSEGDVVALTKKACYKYKRQLTDEQRQKLLAALTEKLEINTEHWEIEWEFN